MAGCAQTSGPVKTEYIHLCVARYWSNEKVQSFLAKHGIESINLGGSLGGMDICVHDRETAFRAREILRANAEKERLNIGWWADFLIHPGDANWSSSRTDPLWLRVADVRFVETPTQTVLSRLEGAGIETWVHFGTSDDCVQVPRESVPRALKVLREAALPGVKIRPPPGFER
jgi:hypothetical protein